MDEYQEYLNHTSNLQILYNLKIDGFPKTEEEQTMLFNKFSDRKNGDYHVSWEHLCEFLPEVDQNFGYTYFLELHKKYDLDGSKDIIKNSTMTDLEKAYLLFVYE